MTTPILEARGLKKTFIHPNSVTILKGVDLTVHSQESVAIMGRSGEGKSTLLHILGTLEKPCEGQLLIQGKKASPFTYNNLRNQHIGFVFQSFHLLEDYTVIENILMPARIARHNTEKGSPYYQKAEELLAQVGLKDRASFFAKQLSGGEKQRVSIARAFLNDPELILADEPSGNLDRTTALDIHDLLFQFASRPGKALILVTHDEELASKCVKTYKLVGGLLV